MTPPPALDYESLQRNNVIDFTQHYLQFPVYGSLKFTARQFIKNNTVQTWIPNAQSMSANVVFWCVFLYTYFSLSVSPVCVRHRSHSSCCCLQCVWCSTWRALSCPARTLSLSTPWMTVSWWDQMDTDQCNYHLQCEQDAHLNMSFACSLWRFWPLLACFLSYIFPCRWLHAADVEHIPPGLFNLFH